MKGMGFELCSPISHSETVSITPRAHPPEEIKERAMISERERTVRVKERKKRENRGGEQRGRTRKVRSKREEA